ncbi:hypothetical protein U9M48_018362 [Paspalum notatum var. saurae]|uniref:Uncharacterized protein n=1 Tax=Paspalum notatum var. saurae TaxID=547442 RepID=A0AAQ3WPQ5_PASNO
MLGCVGDAISKPLWIELTCVFTPDIRIMVNEEDGQQNIHSCRIFDSTELHFLINSGTQAIRLSQKIPLKALNSPI